MIRVPGHSQSIDDFLDGDIGSLGIQSENTIGLENRCRSFCVGNATAPRRYRRGHFAAKHDATTKRCRVTGSGPNPAIGPGAGCDPVAAGTAFVTRQPKDFGYWSTNPGKNGCAAARPWRE